MVRLIYRYKHGQRPSFRHACACAVLLLFITSACGQKAGVYDPNDPSETLGSGAPTPGSFVVDPATGELVAAGGSTASAARGSYAVVDGEVVALDGRGRGERPRPAPNATERVLAAATPPAGGDATGVGRETIKIGIHLPITGAAPVPAIAARSVSLYFSYLEDQGLSINGRRVEVVLRNDEYTTEGARQACKDMVEGEKVFLLLGYVGPHSIQACARYAARIGVPYLAPGSLEPGLTGLSSHFGLSMTYNRQNPLVAQLLVDRFGARDEKNALVRIAAADPPPRFVTAREAMEARGARIDVEHLLTAQPDPLEMRPIVLDLKQKGIENVWFGGSPNHFIFFQNEAVKQGFRPQVVGIGPSVAFDFTLGATCTQADAGHGSVFLHPAPGFVDRDRFDPAFEEAGGTNEIDWMFWGLSKPIAELLELPGPRLTRERFLWYAARAKGIETGVFPDISLSPADHFGGEAMHVLEADCRDRLWHTVEAFYKG